MAISGLFFILTRVFQLVTLIPIIGILSYFVDGYVKANALTPTYILVLFIVSVLAAAWALATLVAYARARHSANVVAAFDLAFVGAFIAAVYLLRGPGTANCTNVDFFANSGGLGVNYSGNKNCALLKAAFALGIINTILFFWSFLLALLVHRHHRDDRVVVKRSYHTSRHSHRSPRSSYDGRRRSGSRHGSRSSRSRRTYYV
ncbi:hypothetical protein C1H76_9232 [Elsinoe australis]|uniref:MARVEL domain-containing protein n=1 Tax=Elsinoe australis TaxID=40998 RepID=A0A2P7YE82_9PEZI|nr:hypothetical protein B9Z65_8589 [Elsinoe australis]TKX18443.1 hypothetical protein C1H76_9232 [Elsinoe australis]